LLFKFEVEFHQTEEPTASIGRWYPTLRYDYDVTPELWSHKSEQNSLCLCSWNAKQMHRLLTVATIELP